MTENKREVESAVFQTVKRFKQDESLKKGSRTQTLLVNDMIENRKLTLEPSFDLQLEDITIKWGKFWVESVDYPVFPAVKDGKKNVVQHFFANIMNKFVDLCNGNKIIYKLGLDGKYNKPTKLGDDVIVQCIPDASVHAVPTVGNRGPDVNIYYNTVQIKGILRIISCWELKPRGTKENHTFSAEEIGQLIDTNMELLRQQPFRSFTLSVLSDGVRFAFFKIIRISSYPEDFKVLQSTTYLKMSGWKVSIMEDIYLLS